MYSHFLETCCLNGVSEEEEMAVGRKENEGRQSGHCYGCPHQDALRARKNIKPNYRPNQVSTGQLSLVLISSFSLAPARSLFLFPFSLPFCVASSLISHQLTIARIISCKFHFHLQFSVRRKCWSACCRRTAFGMPTLLLPVAWQTLATTVK